MEDVQLKFNLLDVNSKKEVIDFIDFLIGKMKMPEKKKSDYKKRILAVSRWSDEDIKLVEENQSFNQFKQEAW